MPIISTWKKPYVEHPNELNVITLMPPKILCKWKINKINVVNSVVEKKMVYYVVKITPWLSFWTNGIPNTERPDEIRLTLVMILRPNLSTNIIVNILPIQR